MKSISKATLYICALISCFLLWSCGPKKEIKTISEHPPLSYNEEVRIFAFEDRFPDGGKVLGVVKLGDNGMFSSGCTYEDVVGIAEMEARKIGANVVKITEHKKPSFWNGSCHTITAILIRIDEEVPVAAKSTEEEEEAADYALLYLYRPVEIGMFIDIGTAFNYNVKMNDSTIFRATNNSKTMVRIRKEGGISLTATMESTETLQFNVKFGEIYYVETYLTMGLGVGRPVLKRVTEAEGEEAFKSIRWGGKWGVPDVITLKNGEKIECIITGSDDEKVYFNRYDKNREKEEWELKNEDIKTIEINSNN